MRVGLALSALLISVTIMAQECPLSAPLTVKDTQQGFAGETGTVWTILPDCSYTVARVIGLKTLDPEKQGKLTSEQQAQLKQLLDGMSVTGFPEQIGGPQVNARRVTLSYGGKHSVLTLAPGGGNLAGLRAAAGNDPAAALLDLANQIKGMTES
jgi:hypothetical protein